jgi:CheY-like chemotaxis protein/glycine cleavage system H lipoate-binding protein
MEKKLNVLVVDDEQIVLDSVHKHLKKEDKYEVFTALSVRRATEIMLEHDIHIIMTDLMMPDIDGLEFMSMVKRENPHIPMIVITGYATINTALQSTQLGAFDYIAKPFTKKELLGVLTRAADLVRAAEKARVTAETPEGELKEADIRNSKMFKNIDDHSWLMMQKDETILLGVKRTFLHTVGKIESIHLPEEGDELRQGGVFLQVISADLQSHSLVAPLSGTVVEVNDKVLKNPELSLQDPYGEGWLIRLKPSKFEYEIKMLGL